MIEHFPTVVYEHACRRYKLSVNELKNRTRIIAVTRDPLAIFNGWLKYYGIKYNTKDKYPYEYAEKALADLVLAYNIFTNTIMDSIDRGYKVHGIVAELFSGNDLFATFEKMTNRIGIKMDLSVINWSVNEVKQSLSNIPVDDLKYIKLTEGLSDSKFKYVEPIYEHTDSWILNEIKKSDLSRGYFQIHHLCTKDFGDISIPKYFK